MHTHTTAVIKIPNSYREKNCIQCTICTDNSLLFRNIKIEKISLDLG